MRVATWNVNSVHARLPRLLAWLARTRPDVVCLQETKTVDEKFPGEAIAAAGYQHATCGQRTYNGVAILSRTPLTDVAQGGLPGDDGAPDPQARLVAATTCGLRVMSVYVPNGQAMGTAKCAYKLAWLARLRALLGARENLRAPVVVAGDMNVAPRDSDVAEPARWAETVLCHPEVRAAYRAVLDAGLVDDFARLHPEGGIYSWWDYRALGFAKGNGLRIDALLTSRPLSPRVTAAGVDRDERKGERPSDHAPVWSELTV